MMTRAAIVVALAIWLLSCSDDPAGPDREELVELIPLEDIPYDALGGGTLAFERISEAEENASGVYVIDVDSRTSYGWGGIALQQPSLSPDGSKFVFTHPTPYSRDRRFENTWDVYMTDNRGANLAPITALPGRELTPVWFPDGSEIAFVEVTNDGNLHVYRQSPSSDASDRLLVKTFPPTSCTNLGTEQPISVSYKGEALFAHILCGGVQEIATLDLNNGDYSVLVRDSVAADQDFARFRSTAWSPDGTRIAYMEEVASAGSTKKKLTRIKVMNADGSDTLTVASFPGSGGVRWCCTGEHAVVWSPDGSKIAFNIEKGDLQVHIYVVGSDGEGLAQITSKSDADDRSLSWVP